jgi:GNAT superfamily N-acetyltransferase
MGDTGGITLPETRYPDPEIHTRRAVPEDASWIHRIAESLRYRPPGSDKGFLVHVRPEEGYRRILEASMHSLVAEEGGKPAGFLTVLSMAEMEDLRKDVLAQDKAVEHVMALGDATVLYADQIGVDLEARSRGVGQHLAASAMASDPAAHFLAAIMHKPAKNTISLRLALRNGWRLSSEILDNGFTWGIYEYRGAGVPVGNPVSR